MFTRTPEEQAASRRLRKFGANYYWASHAMRRQGHDARLQAVRDAADILGSVNAWQIQEIVCGYGAAESFDEETRGAA